MHGNNPALVVIAAGGLGTRVHHWARFIPKEFYPVDGRPGLIHVLEEIAALGRVQIVVVYHPYYEQFATWARQVLSRHDYTRYARAAGRDITPAVPADLTVSFIPQHGPYADLTSVFNGADYLTALDDLYIVFADNLYPGPSPLPALRDTLPGSVTVLATRYDPARAPSRGILITTPAANSTSLRTVEALVEKPDPEQARLLQERHGTPNLLMLEGRALLTASFIEFARIRHSALCGTGEPKLALAIGAYAREHQVIAVPTRSEVVDLGSAGTPAPVLSSA